MTQPAERLRLAVVGCGAQAELSHLPVLVKSADVVVTTLVDKDQSRAAQLAAKFSVPSAVGDYREIATEVDAAIVSLPNYLHAPVSADLLRRGVHVLVEKPMALTSSECDEVVQAAETSGAVLGVGLDFRFLRQSRYVKRVLEDSLLGDIAKFDLRIGHVLTKYAVRSDYLIRKETAGGGVLIDLAVHAIDLVLWWFGEWDDVEYWDDAVGGVEANCEVHVRLRSGMAGVIEASRIRRLRNTCIIQGTRGTLEVGIWNPNGAIRLQIPGVDDALVGHVGLTDETWHDVYRRQLDDFVTAVRSRKEPFVPAREGRRSVDLIQACYASRRLLSEPGLFAQEPRVPDVLGDSRNAARAV